jgi:hypothetical protein
MSGLKVVADNPHVAKHPPSERFPDEDIDDGEEAESG